MKKHTSIYMKHFGYDISSWIPCTGCNSTSVDVHHLDNKGAGGSKTKDYIENLVAVCRDCHNKAHDHPEFNEKLKEIHLLKLKEL